MKSSSVFRNVFFSLSFAGALSVSAAASAADLLPPLDVEPFAPNWSGYYAGLFVGGLFSQNDADTIGTTAFQSLPTSIVPSSLDLDSEALIGGVTLGYNLQAGNVVYGVEGDFGFTDLGETGSFTGDPVLGTRLTTSAQSQIDYFSTIRARAGFALSDNLMIFGTGGLALGQVETSASVVGVDAPALAWAGSDESWEAGWTVGGGAEVRVSDPVTLKLDALYYDLGDSSVTASGNDAVRGVAALNGIDYVAETENTGFTVRMGINARF